jgi:hypothetical protein
LMSEHAFFEYRAKLISTQHVEEGEPNPLLNQV